MSASSLAAQCRRELTRAVFVYWRFRELIWQLTWRDVTGRYKGSYFGLLWSFLNPLFMLAIYTFVFSVVMKARWGINPQESQLDYALTLFCGLIPFTVFTESVSRASGLVVSHVSYVKKVVFPLEILPIVVLYSSLLQAGISMAILIACVMLLLGTTTWTIAYLPVVLLPLVALSLGFCWFLAALGVFIRDIGHTVGIVTQALFFVTPILYPTSAVPKEFRPVLELNPLSAIVESVRCVVIWGKAPPWSSLGAVAGLSLVVYFGGYYWFMRSKRAFADVL